MKSFVAFAAILACAAAAPGVILAHEPVVAHVAAPVVHTVPLVGHKTTITKSSQIVNHGTPVHTVHAVHAAPIVHAPVVLKTAPVVHHVHAAPIVHAAPVVHAVHHAPLVHSSPVVIKTAPAAISHSSSSVVHHGHHHVPLVAVH